MIKEDAATTHINYYKCSSECFFDDWGRIKITIRENSNPKASSWGKSEAWLISLWCHEGL